MPRSASQPQDNALQGNLFGAPEPAAPSTTATSNEPEAATHDLSDDELGADAAARPRTRQTKSSDTTSKLSAARDSEPSRDDPAWAHHSQPDPPQSRQCCATTWSSKQLSREGAAHCLGDFFECFFEDAIELSRVWNSPSQARKAARPSAGCRWQASPTTPLSATALN